MNAIEFVKKFGLDESEEIINGIPDKFKNTQLILISWCNDKYKYSDRFKPRRSLVNVGELKQVVDSFDLIDSLGGIEYAKNEMLSRYIGFNRYKEIQKAINLVEQCNE